jgi:magnesium-transporting ATPase (P-type)
MQIVLAIITTLLLVAPGVAIGFAWRKCSRRSDPSISRTWNTFNIATLSLVTLFDLYLISAMVLTFTRWADSFEHWAFYRYENSVFTMGILGAFVCGVSVRFGRGVCRKEIARAALLFAFMTFIFILIVLPS